MALCVAVNKNGFLIPSSQTIDSCTSYVLNTAQEYQTLPTLIDIFNIPIAADMEQMWMIGFSLPMIAYLTAWSFGVVISMFSDKRYY